MGHKVSEISVHKCLIPLLWAQGEAIHPGGRVQRKTAAQLREGSRSRRMKKRPQIMHHSRVSPQ